MKVYFRQERYLAPMLVELGLVSKKNPFNLFLQVGILTSSTHLSLSFPKSALLTLHIVIFHNNNNRSNISR